MYDLEHILLFCLITSIRSQIYDNNYLPYQYLMKKKLCPKIAKLH